jgi:hypothetical protein
MADTQEAVRRLTITAPSDGTIPKQTADLNALAKAQGNVAVASQATEKATLSLDQKFASIERRYVAQVRAQQDYEKIQRQVNAAVAQNPALQDRANAVLAAAKDRHDQLANSQKALGVITSDLTSRVQASAGSFGVVGSALTALGPVGLGVAATIGTLIAGLNIASDAAHNLAEKAKALREFSEATGLTTQQVQALSSEAGKFGIDGETLSAGLQKFTSGFQQLRLGTGDLLTQIRRINPALADQIQSAQDAATAFTLFGRAVAQTDNIFQRNSLLKAGLGKGSAIFGGLFDSAPDVAGLTAAYTAAGKGIDENLIKKLAQLQVEIDKTKSATSTVFASIFAESVLSAEKEFASILLDIAKTLKAISDFKFPEAPDWVKTALSAGGRAALNLSPLGPLVNGISAARNAIRSGPDTSSSMSQAQAISDAVPRTRSYNQIVSDQFMGPPAPGGKTPEALAADLKNLVSVLGSSATPSERLAANIAELGIRAKEAGVGADALARGVSALRLDDALARQSAHNAALGQAATVTDILAEKTLSLAKAQQQGAGLTRAQIDNQMRLTQAQALGTFQIDAATDAEKVRMTTLTMSTQEAIAYSIVQTKINEAKAKGTALTEQEIQQLQKSAEAYAQTKTQADRYADALQTVKDTAKDFASSFVQGLLQGKNGMDALTAAAGNLASKLADKALTDLFSGNFLQAGVEAVVAIGAQLFSNGGREQEKLKQAQAAWKEAGPAFETFLKQMTGGASGDIRNQIQQAAQQTYAYGQQAYDAGDYAAMAAGGAALTQFITRQFQRFQATFDAVAQGYSDGLGPNSPFLKAINDAGTALDTALNFIDNADVAGAIGSVAKATEAAQSYLVSLLQTPPALSEVQTRMLQIQGTAAALQGALQQLGMSSADAASAIQGGVTKAIADLKATFEQSLTERFNTATGAGYLNDAADLVKQHQQDLADAAVLGNDPALLAQIAATFGAESQKIIEDAGLVGDSFDDFIKMFPELADVVHQATNQLAASIQTINDYLKSLQFGDKSILSPQDQLNAAQSQFSEQLALAQKGDATALGSITQIAATLLDQAKSFYASSAGYTDIFEQVTAALRGLTGSSGMALGGIVPGMAGGGMVGNGTFGVDSVIARYAGGGSIGLAGGEYVMPAAQTQSHLPMLEAMRRGSNDNGQGFAALGQQLTRAMAGCSIGEINALRDGFASLSGEVRRLSTAIEGNKPKPARPSAKVAA